MKFWKRIVATVFSGRGGRERVLTTSRFPYPIFPPPIPFCPFLSWLLPFSKTGDTDTTDTVDTLAHVSFHLIHDLSCKQLGKVSNFTWSKCCFFLSWVRIFVSWLFLQTKFCFQPWRMLNGSQETIVGFVSLSRWYAVTNNESLPFWISLPLPAILEILLPALSSPAPCFPGLLPPCPFPLFKAFNWVDFIII